MPSCSLADENPPETRSAQPPGDKEARERESACDSPAVGAKGRDGIAALCVGAALFAFYLLTTSARAPVGDEREYISVSANLIALHRPVATFRGVGPDGREGFQLDYAKYPLGQSLLALPFVWAAMTYASRAGMSAPAFDALILYALPAVECAAIGALVFLLLRLLACGPRKLRLSRGQAAAVALASGAATQLWPSASTLFADTSAAFFVALCVYALARYRLRPGATWWWLVAATSAAAAAFSCKNTFGLVWPAVAIYGAWALAERSRGCAGPVSRTSSRFALAAVVSALPFVLAVAGQLAWNRARYGSIWQSGYGEGRDADFGFNTPVWAGLYGILFSSGRSFFLYSPLCLLGLIGLSSFWRGRKAESLLVLGIAVPMALAYAKWWAWHGGWEWGSRFFLFLAPLLAWTAASVWRAVFSPGASRATRLARRGATGALVLVSFAIQIPGVAIHPSTYWRLIASEISLFEHPLYEKGVWDARDDMLLTHFVPEFSPIASQTWMVWATLNSGRLDDETLARSAPWRSLNPKWTPRQVRPYLKLDLWLWSEWRRPEASHVWIAATAGILVLLLSAGLAGTMLSTRRT